MSGPDKKHIQGEAELMVVESKLCESSVVEEG